jgi:hypothetical protein
MEQRWNDTDRGNRRTRRGTCPSATLCTTSPTWTALVAKPALHGEKPATNRLSYGTALVDSYSAGQEISCLWKRKFRYIVHKSPSLYSILSQQNPIHILILYFSNINYLILSYLRLGLENNIFSGIFNRMLFTFFFTYVVHVLPISSFFM